jgi:hypothetical protein
MIRFYNRVFVFLQAHNSREHIPGKPSGAAGPETAAEERSLP